jgi:hypothetical protein
MPAFYGRASALLEPHHVISFASFVPTLAPLRQTRLTPTPLDLQPTPQFVCATRDSDDDGLHEEDQGAQDRLGDCRRIQREAAGTETEGGPTAVACPQIRSVPYKRDHRLRVLCLYRPLLCAHAQEE